MGTNDLVNLSRDQSELKKYIRELRSKAALTQEQFAVALGVTYTTVNRWENGRSSPSPMAMKVIDAYAAKYLEIPGSQGEHVDIAGRWESAHGYIYDIAQTGNNLTWTVVSPIRESGSGTISGDTLNASWNGDNGDGTARGTVILKQGNRATEIRWSNGGILFRGIGSQGEYVDISGRWESAHGYIYDIAQTGNNLTWTVVSPIRESGSGTISGDTLDASWNGDKGGGTARGIVALNQGNIATKIRWSNGAVFFR